MVKLDAALATSVRKEPGMTSTTLSNSASVVASEDSASGDISDIVDQEIYPTEGGGRTSYPAFCERAPGQKHY